MIALDEQQLEALRRLRSGCVLCGGVGSGKSITALGWYYLENGGAPESLMGADYIPMDDPPADLYIITTAQKRDRMEWDGELAHFLLCTDRETGLYRNRVTVDSWNNLHKYTDVKNAYFLFDEQRVTGKGVWVKSFLKIAKGNRWILLSATPGDTWMDYIPLFLANGFYKNRSEFIREHVVYANTKFPKVSRYLYEKKLERLRDQILVGMAFHRPTESHHTDIFCEYDTISYKKLMRTRFDPWKQEPILNAGGLCYCLRKLVNSSEQRQAALLEIAEDHPKIVLFYSFDYELEILTRLGWPDGTEIAQWNGHRHESIPAGERWVYLVNYSAGAEGWNCTKTDTMVFYSQHYSYKVMTQAAGRIDRRNTPYKNLWYYYLKSRSPIDLAISRALSQKRAFNENRFISR